MVRSFAALKAPCQLFQIASLGSKKKMKELHIRAPIPPYVDRWSAEDDAKLKEGVEAFGQQFSTIASILLPTKTTQSCRARWNNVVDPLLNTGPWTAEVSRCFPLTPLTAADPLCLQEDSLLVQQVQMFGTEKWTTIARHMHKRSTIECRERSSTPLLPCSPL